MRTHKQIIVAHHLVMTGYGHWLSNDIRGSGSEEIRDPKFEDLGPIHHGRKPIQPSRDELRDFYRRANPLLNFDPIWFDSAKRQALADAFGEVVRTVGYTVWACAVCSNHAHLLVRRHRDDAVTIWDEFTHASREAIRSSGDVPDDHPVWSDRPYKVFIYTPPAVEGRIEYIDGNPLKEGLVPQHHPFVVPYDRWPYPRQSRK